MDQDEYQLCRLCFKLSDDCLNLKSSINKTQEILKLAARFSNDQFACAETYSDCFLLCTNINLLNDKKHVNICKLCGDKILSAFNMICRARLSELLLQELHVELEDMESNLLNEKEFDKRNKCITSKTDNSKYMCPNCYNNYSSKSLLDDHYSYKICKKSAIFNLFMDMENCCLPIESITEDSEDRFKNEKSEEIRDFDENLEETHPTELEINTVKDDTPADLMDTAGNQSSEECSEIEPIFLDTTDMKMKIKRHKKRLMKKNININEREKFECDECDKVYFQKRSLKLHKRKHSGDLIPCEICNKGFVNNKELRVHMRFHNRDYPFVCEICGNKFALMGHLRTHVNKHQGLKYQCEECDKQFLSLKGLNDHRPTHTGIMPFPCCYCERGYPSATKYKYHLLTKHKIEPTDEELLRSRKSSIAPTNRLRRTHKLVEDNKNSSAELETKSQSLSIKKKYKNTLRDVTKK